MMPLVHPGSNYLAAHQHQEGRGPAHPDPAVRTGHAIYLSSPALSSQCARDEVEEFVGSVRTSPLVEHAPAHAVDEAGYAASQHPARAVGFGNSGCGERLPDDHMRC